MKKLLNIILAAGASSMLLVSCLKDTPVTDYENGIKPIVMIPNGNWPKAAAPQPIAFDFTSTPQEIRLYARVSWDKTLGKDLKVTFKKEPTALAEVNTKFGSNLVYLADNAYELPATEVTIPANQNEAYISVKVFPDKVDLSKENALAFSITDASGETVASNFKTIVIPVLIKNIYEGSYAVTGYFFHPSAPRAIGASKYFGTINANRVIGQLGDLGGWYINIDVSGSNDLTNFLGSGSTPLPPSAGFMTLDNPAGISTYPGPGGFTHAAYPNKYDPATKTFLLHYGYQTGSGGQNEYLRQIYEKWTRQ